MKRPWERNGRIIEDALGRPIECEVCPCPVPPVCPACANYSGFDYPDGPVNETQTATISIAPLPCGAAERLGGGDVWPCTLTGVWNGTGWLYTYAGDGAGKLHLNVGDHDAGFDWVQPNFLVTCEGIWRLAIYYTIGIQDDPDPCGCTGEQTGEPWNNCMFGASISAPIVVGACMKIVEGVIVTESDIVVELPFETDPNDCGCSGSVTATIHLGP